MREPGHCFWCGKLAWRGIRDPKTGEEVILWPDPASTYARVSHNAALFVGLIACRDCSSPADPPKDIEGEIQEWETAKGRYTFWFTDRFGEVLSAWLSDHVGMDEQGREKVLAQWEEDRACRVS